MALITFLGGPETGDVAHCDWGRFKFTIGQPTECNDPHIVAKASANRFFRVESTPPPAREDPLAKARAAKAAKRATSHETAGTAYDSGAAGHELVGRAKSPDDAS